MLPVNGRTIKAQFRKPPPKNTEPLVEEKAITVEEEVIKVEETPIVEESSIEESVVEEPTIEEPAEEEEKLDLSSMTKKQLIAVAQKEKVTYKNLSKADLLEALQILLD